MTRRTAIIVSLIAILCGASYSVYDFHQMSNDSTSDILRSCNINPTNGAWIK